MADVGSKLTRIFKKKSIIASFVGFVYSLVVTIAPVLLVIGNIQFMSRVLGFGGESYIRRELFTCTVLYIFIFALLSVSPGACGELFLSGYFCRQHLCYEDVRNLVWNRCGARGFYRVDDCVCQAALGGKKSGYQRFLPRANNQA